MTLSGVKNIIIYPQTEIVLCHDFCNLEGIISPCYVRGEEVHSKIQTVQRSSVTVKVLLAIETPFIFEQNCSYYMSPLQLEPSRNVRKYIQKERLRGSQWGDGFHSWLTVKMFAILRLTINNIPLLK